MSKMSKTIAMLGVVAGLGVAALPLSTYALTIDGTKPTENPVADATYDGNKDGEVSEDVGVTLTIDDELKIAAGNDNADNKVDLTAGAHTANTTVNVVTNNSKGYNLALKGAANENPTSLTSTAATKDQILTWTGIFDAPTALAATAADSYWGYSVSNSNANLAEGYADKYAAFGSDKFAGVKETDQVIVDVTKATVADGDVTTINFKADLKDGQAAGTYNGVVTFTASNNL